MGYARAGFEVVGVDIKPQPHYPFEFVQEDALEILAGLLAGYHFQGEPVEQFAAIHASPPCQAYIQRNKNLITKWPKLVEPVRERLIATGLPYVIENVPAAPLRATAMLCGTMFGLPLLRHRIFEVSPPFLFAPATCNHWGTVADGDFAAVYAFGGKGRRGWDEHGNRTREPGSAQGPAWSVAMGIDWMTQREMAEAIPPAYTEFIGKHLLSAVKERVR